MRDERETLAVRDGRVERHFRAASAGFGVRVLVDGAWGFGARAGERDDAAALEAAAEAALATARGRGVARRRRASTLADEEPQRGRYATPVARDFFAVPLADKLALLDGVTDALRAAAGHARALGQRPRRRAPPGQAPRHQRRHQRRAAASCTRAAA